MLDTRKSSVPGVELKPAGPQHGDFLFTVFMSTQQGELAAMRAAGTYSEAFIAHHFRQQFDWQDRYYRSDRYPNARFDLIVHNSTPVGRFYVNRSPKDFRIIDIAILPEYRRMRIGEALIRELQQEAERAGAVVSIHVEQTNPAAIAFYKRLGFDYVDAPKPNELHWYMEYRPAQPVKRFLIPDTISSR